VSDWDLWLWCYWLDCLVTSCLCSLGLYNVSVSRSALAVSGRGLFLSRGIPSPSRSAALLELQRAAVQRDHVRSISLHSPACAAFLCSTTTPPFAPQPYGRMHAAHTYDSCSLASRHTERGGAGLNQPLGQQFVQLFA